MELNDIISSGLLELYALGMTNKEETEQVEAWARQYPAVQAEIYSLQSGMETYAFANAVAPIASVKEKIFSELNLTTKNNGSPQQKINTAKIVPVSSFWKRVAAASVILFIGSAVLNVVYFNKYDDVNHKYEIAKNEQQQLQQQLALQQQENDDMKNDMSVVQSKYSMPVSLHGLDAAPDAAAKIFWMKNTGEVYIDPSNLPETPNGMQYQLWAIVDGKPLDAGLIVTGKGNKYSYQKMKTFGKAEAFAVTLETKGGNPTPKGDMYVMGKM